MTLNGLRKKDVVGNSFVYLHFVVYFFASACKFGLYWHSIRDDRLCRWRLGVARIGQVERADGSLSEPITNS